MIDRLYLGRGDRTSGPFSAAQLRGLAAAGRIRPTDAVWREGAIEKSVDAAKVKNLFPSPQTLTQEGASEACEPTPPPADVFYCPTSAPQVPLDSAPVPSEIVPEPTPVQTAAVPPVSPALLGAGDPTSPARPPERVRKRRAVALQGATILSQDGMTVQYRKKCTKCGFEDRCRSSMPIGNGMTRIHFYCPACRKGRDVQIQGIIQ